MKRVSLFVLLGLLTATFALTQFAQAQNGVLGSVSMGTSSPQFTAVDPFANGLTPSNPLKPPRPFWYVVDKNGLTIMGLRTEKTGALMVTGPPIDVVANQVVGYVPWPDAIAITQPDGEVPIDPSIAEDHGKFAWRSEVGGAWEPVGITVSYPTEEALASNSETPPTYVYVVMKHSGHEWQSTPVTQLPPGRDPNLRDRITQQPDLTKDGSLLVQIDVSQPNYPVDLFPTGAPIGSGLLGHDAGQPAFDAALDSVYVGNMPSTSLPTVPAVPNDLTSFVSVLTLAPAELPAPGEGAPAPVTVTVLCGPEHQDYAILAGFPEAWACIAEGGEGPFQWTFSNLPGWLTAHIDPVTGKGDGILYGTPPAGNYIFEAHVDDFATTPPGTGDATISLTVSADPLTEYENGELEWEVGVPGAVAIEGTAKGGGDPCALTPTSSPGSLVPAWVDVKQISGRFIDNSSLGGPQETTIGCVVMGTPPISGERFEFQMPNLQFVWPSQNLSVVISGQVAGPYTFDPLPQGVGLSGLAWHQIDKIHDASTEADLLNHEFFGIEPYTGQIYRIVTPYAGLEAEGTVVPPPALEGELDEVVPFGEALTALTAARPDIATLLNENPNLRVKFGNLVVEANPNPNVFVTAIEISDPTGVNPTVIPIGGPINSQFPVGEMLKVTGTRDAAEPADATLSVISPIGIPGVQASFLGLDSDLAPAIPGTEPGQHDNGILWVTGPNTGNVGVVNTTGGKFAQLLTVPSATALGGVSVYPTTSVAYVAGTSTNTVAIFGPGSDVSTSPAIWSANSITFSRNLHGTFTVLATGWPLPSLSLQGALPPGVGFTDNGDGTAIFSGTPTAVGSYPLLITATNGGEISQNFTLIVTEPVLVTLDTVPTGLSMTVDGITYTGPQTLTWPDGSYHTLAISSPQAGSAGTQYAFANWSDGGAQTHKLKAVAGTTSYTASFTTQYLLTTSAAPVEGGTVSPLTGYYDANAVVNVSATASEGYGFSGWSGDLTGTNNPEPVTMSAPRTVTASFYVLPPEVAVVSPNGGERLYTNSPYTITWSASYVPQNATFSVSFSSNNGTTYSLVPGCAGGLLSTARSCVWTAPGPVTSNGRIRVDLISGGYIVASDASDARYSVLSASPTVTVTAPNTAVTWVAGTVKTIRWTHNLGLNSSVNVDVSRNGGNTWSPIVAGVRNTTATAGLYNWTVTGPATTAALVRVSWTGGSASDTSDVNFTIADPRVTVTIPNTAVNWGIGSIQTIRWTYNLGANTHYKIELTRNGGSTWEVLNPDFLSTGASGGSLSWSVNGPVTTMARIRVSELGGVASDTSDVNFTIADPRVTVSSPNTAVNWGIGSTQTIRWTHNLGANAHYRIELTRDGSTWEILQPDFPSASATAGSFAWTVTGPATTKAKVRVSWLGGTASDTSNVNFAIQ